MFLVVDSGLAWNNTVAIVRGLSGARVAFVRTPKVNTTDAGARKEQGRARCGSRGAATVVECGLCAYLTLGLALAVSTGQYMAIPKLLLYALGCGYMGAHGIADIISSLAKRQPTLAPAISADTSPVGSGR